MKKMLYKNEEDWNEEEKKTKKASYLTFTNYFFDDMILCNNIVNVDDLELVCGLDYDENSCEYVDIFQYYIVNVSNWNLTQLQEKYQDDVILYYSNLLDVYVLGVTHFGTAWDYVTTDIPLTSNIENLMN